MGTKHNPKLSVHNIHEVWCLVWLHYPLRKIWHQCPHNLAFTTGVCKKTRNSDEKYSLLKNQPYMFINYLWTFETTQYCSWISEIWGICMYKHGHIQTRTILFWCPVRAPTINKELSTLASQTCCFTCSNKTRMLNTIVFRVLHHPDVQECILQPFYSHGYICDGVKDNLCIKMLDKVFV